MNGKMNQEKDIRQNYNAIIVIVSMVMEAIPVAVTTKNATMSIMIAMTGYIRVIMIIDTIEVILIIIVIEFIKNI
jgi:hypothetical protein